MEIDDDDPLRLPVRAFRKFMAAGFGDIAAAIAGDHRCNLDPILLELDGIGDDVFGDVIDGHWFLRVSAASMIGKVLKRAKLDLFL